MENIVAYDSDGSENSQNPTPKKEVAEHGRSSTNRASMLEAEWDSFEKMIGDSPATTNSKTIGDAPLPVPAPVPPVGVPAPVAPSSESEAASSSSSSSSESDSDSEAESEDDKKKSSKSKAKKKSKSSSESSDSSSSEEEEEEEEEDSSDSDSSSEDEKSGNSSSASVEAKTEVTTKSSPLVSQAKTADLVIVESANQEHVGMSDKSGSPEKATTENSEVKGRRSSERRRSSHHSQSRSRSRDRHRRRSSSGSRRRHGRSRSRSPRRHRSSRSRRSRSRERHRDRKGRSPDRQKSHRSSHHRSSRSRSRDRRSSRSDHKRHSSRDRHRRKRSRDRRRRSRSTDRRSRRGRDRSRDRHRRSRSRSRTPDGRHGRYKRGKKDDTDKKPRSFKEHLKQQLLHVQKQAADGKLTLDFELQKKLMEDSKIASGVKLSAATNPLVSLSTTGEKVTPQEALLQTMAAMHQKAQELTGVAVPKYYNPAAVNPLKYAEQVQKRKLLWSKAKDKKEDTTAAWGQAGFNQDQDGKVAAKFRKLMGINKSEEEMAAESEQHPASTSSHSTSTPAQDAQIHPKAEELMQKQQELFQQLDKEYEFARMTTHTHRGVGLGFASHVPTFPK